MSETERLINASAADVFAVLADGWSYAAWVVGASRIRDVDPDWPLPGSSIHHSVGAWPLLINDTTTVVKYEPSRLLELKVRAWPTGEGTVELEVTEADGVCHVVMRERMTKGPATLLPPQIADPLLHVRNAETLQRLALLAEGRAKNKGS